MSASLLSLKRLGMDPRFRQPCQPPLAHRIEVGVQFSFSIHFDISARLEIVDPFLGLQAQTFQFGLVFSILSFEQLKTGRDYIARAGIASAIDVETDELGITCSKMDGLVGYGSWLLMNTLVD